MIYIIEFKRPRLIQPYNQPYETRYVATPRNGATVTTHDIDLAHQFNIKDNAIAIAKGITCTSYEILVSKGELKWK